MQSLTTTGTLVPCNLTSVVSSTPYTVWVCECVSVWVCEYVEGEEETCKDYVAIQFTYTHKSCCDVSCQIESDCWHAIWPRIKFHTFPIICVHVLKTAFNDYKWGIKWDVCPGVPTYSWLDKSISMAPSNSVSRLLSSSSLTANKLVEVAEEFLFWGGGSSKSGWIRSFSRTQKTPSTRSHLVLPLSFLP